MATYDLTSKDTAFVNTDSIAALRGDISTAKVRKIETVIDVEKMISNGYVMAAADVFQALTIPAGTFVLAAGAEVHKAFNGTSPAVDIDFAAGDDIVDGADVTSTGFCAGGTNGQGVSTSGTITFVQFVTAEDTIDVVLNAGASDVTEGVLRVFAVVVDMNETGGALPTEVSRDQLA